MVMCDGVYCYQGKFIMLDCKKAYELICEAINRNDKSNEFETIFGQNKTVNCNNKLNIDS